MAVLLLAACTAQPRAQVRPAPAIRAVEPIIYAAQGKPLVIPLSLAPTAEPPSSIEIAFGAEEAHHASIFWVQIDRLPIPAIKGDAERIAARWLAWRDRWTVTPPWHATRPGARGFLAALVSPLDGREPDSITIANARHPLVWIPSNRAESAPPPLTAPDSPLLEAANRLLREDPSQRWRADLYRVQDVTPFVGRRDDGRDPLLEALADQTAARWRFALGRLAEADADLARRLTAHLGGVVGFAGALGGAPGASAALPCRQEDPLGEEGLLRDLLSSRLSPEAKAATARVWLQARRRTLVWVIDDASTTEGFAGHAAATFGVANIDGAAIAASVNGGLGAELATIPPAGAAQLQPVVKGAVPSMEEQVTRSFWGVPQAASTPDPRARARRARLGEELTIRSAGETFTRRVHTIGTLATPPGASIGPLATEWTMARLIAHGGAAQNATPPGYADTPLPAEDWLTMGVLYRDAPLAGAAGANGSSGSETGEEGWTLYLECAAPPPLPAPLLEELGVARPGDGPDNAGEDAVRLWFGPFGAPTCVLKIGRDGVVIDETPRPPSARSNLAQTRGVASMPGVGRHVRLIREEDRWVLWARVPEGCIQDGVVRLGVERIDARGERTTWPRAVLPWQIEPGRAVIDLTSWGDLGM